MMRSATRWTDRVIGERRLRRAGVVVATALVLPSVAVSATISATADFPPGYAAHHTYAEARATLRDLAATHPAIVRLSNIGRSHEGRKLFVVKISDNARREEPEPEVYIDGGIHGHEHLSTEQTLAVIDWLVDGYAADARITAIVDSTEIWIAPLVNPDGATYDISGGSFHRWRKNRQPNGAGQAVGTDVNRNFGYRWGCCGGSSANPRSDYFRGRETWSTPESRAIRDFVRGRITGGKQQIRLALTIHSHGEFVMYPFGYTSDPRPADMRRSGLRQMRALADGITDRNGYQAVQAGQLYRSAGTFMDWAYARHGILALTLELGPAADVTDGWYVRDEEMAAELDRNRDALLWFLQQAATVG